WGVWTRGVTGCWRLDLPWVVHVPIFAWRRKRVVRIRKGALQKKGLLGMGCSVILQKGLSAGRDVVGGIQIFRKAGFPCLGCIDTLIGRSVVRAAKTVQIRDAPGRPALPVAEGFIG